MLNQDMDRTEDRDQWWVVKTAVSAATELLI